MAVDDTTEAAATGTETELAVSALFCGCGARRRPTGGGTLACTAGCERTVEVTDRLRAGLTTVERRAPRPPLSAGGDEDGEIHVGYTTQAYCGDCEAEVEALSTVRQLRAADEAPTRLLECGACGHRWREDD